MKKRGDTGSLKNILFMSILLLGIFVAVKLLMATPDDISYTPASGSYLYGNSTQVFTVTINETIANGSAWVNYLVTGVDYTTVAMTCDNGTYAPNSTCMNNTIDLSALIDGDTISYFFNWTNDDGTAQNGTEASPHTATIDKVDPVIDTITITSNKPSYLNVSSISDSAATVYFNSVTGEGGGQVVTITVTFTEAHPESLTGNASLGSSAQTNDTDATTLSISYTINADENSNATLINVTDKVGRTDSAIITWTQDNTDPTVHVKNITESSDFLYNESVNVTYFGDGMGDTEQSFVIGGNATDADVGLLKVSFSTLLGDSPSADTTEPGNWSATYDANSSDSTGTITITATDRVGNNGSATITVTKDTTNPAITLNGIIEASEFLYNDTGNSKLYFGDDMPTNQSFGINGTATDGGAGLGSIVYSTTLGDSPDSDTSSPWLANYSAGTSDVNSTIVVTAIDNVGNNNTANISVILDDQNPAIDTGAWSESSSYLYISGTTLYFGTGMGSAQNAVISGTASDSAGDDNSGLQKANFSDEGVFGNAPSDDTSAADWSGTYEVNSSATAANSPVTVTVVDNVGNIVTATYDYASDTTAPVASSINPTNTSIIGGNSTSAFSITANENITNGVIYYQKSDAGGYSSITPVCTGTLCTNNTLDFSSSATYPDGTIIYYYFTFDDLAGNSATYGAPNNYSYVTIDRNNASIQIMSPADSAWEATQTPTFIFNFTDSVSKNASCTIQVDGTPVGTNASVLNNTKTTIVSNTTLTTEGSKTWNVSCTDLAGHTNESTTQTFTVDVNNPTVTLETNPADNSWTTSTTPNFEFNVTDAGDTTLNCSLYVDGSYNSENSSTLSANHTVFTAESALSEATHTWFIRCEDSGGLSDNSSTRTLNVDDTAPAIALVSTNNTWTNNATPTIIFNVSDNVDTTLDCALGINNANYSTNTSTLNGTETTFIVNDTLSDGNYTWNITCTDSAGKQNNSEIYTIKIDTVAPATTLGQNPADNSWTSSTTPDFEFNVTDARDGELDCNLYIDGTPYGQNESALNATNMTTITANASLSEAQHTWYVVCVDNATNSNTSATRTLNVDNTVPDIALESPVDNGYSNDTTPDLTFTVSDNLDTTLSCTVGINNDNYGTNTSVQNGTSTAITANATLSEGTYIWNVTCEDSAGKSNVSVNYTLTIDETAPSAVTLQSPANGTWSNDGTPDFTFNFTDALSINSSCTLYLNGGSYGTNESAFNNTMTTITANASLTSGTNYTWNITCTDLAGNTKYGDGRLLQVDTVAPTVTLVEPANNNWSSDTTPDFYFNVTDATAINTSCVLYLDDVSNQTNTSVPVNELKNGFTVDADMSEAQHRWNVTCTDPAGNIGNSGARIIYIDNTEPNVNLTSPADDAWTNDTTPGLSFVVEDNLANSSLTCVIGINNSSYGSNSSVLNGTSTTIDVDTALEDAAYLWNITCTDQAGKSNVSINRTINIDTTAPSSIELRSPTNSSWTADTTPDFVFNVTDNLDTTLNCTVYVDGSNVGSNVSSLNNTATTITSSALSNNSDHYWNVTCEDSAGNTLTSSTYKLSVATTAPTVDKWNPVSDSAITNRSQIFNVTSSAAAECKYDVDTNDYSDMSYTLTGTETTHTGNLSNVLTIDKTYTIYVACNNTGGVSPVIDITYDFDTRSSYSIVRPEDWNGIGNYFSSDSWNSFELPLWLLQNTSSLSGNYNITTVLASVDGNYSSFYGYNGTDWQSYQPGAATNSFKNFTYNDVGKAYYIYANTSNERIQIT